MISYPFAPWAFDSSLFQHLIQRPSANPILRLTRLSIILLRALHTDRLARHDTKGPSRPRAPLHKPTPLRRLRAQSSHQGSLNAIRHAPLGGQITSTPPPLSPQIRKHVWSCYPTKIRRLETYFRVEDAGSWIYICDGVEWFESYGQ
jgi:hypothetical protein